jgi:DNA repair protein RadC
VNRYTIKTVKVTLAAAEPPPRKAGSPLDAAAILRPIFAGLDPDQEHLVILTLDNKRRVTGYKVCHSGGMTSSVVDPRIVFRSALLLGATAIIVAHNHPAGDPAPSAEDRQITDALKQAGTILEIPVLDHIILGDGQRFFSFAQS